MKKKLFTNYNFEFDKNEKKLLINFSKQALKQMSSDDKFFAEVKAFNSILEKLQSNSGGEQIKFTKDERTRLSHQLKQNADFMKKQIDKSGFFKKWLYRSLHKQYINILENHFKD